MGDRYAPPLELTSAAPRLTGDSLEDERGGGRRLVAHLHRLRESRCARIQAGVGGAVPPPERLARAPPRPPAPAPEQGRRRGPPGLPGRAARPQLHRPEAPFL